MPFTIANKDIEEIKIQALIDFDPELKKAAEEFDKEYEARKRLVLARQEAEHAF